jgi:hypothetical protein
MTIRELIELLETAASEIGDDTPINAAIQPSWPMAKQIAGVSITEGIAADVHTAWIAVSDSHPDELSPYAPSDAWQGHNLVN